MEIDRIDHLVLTVRDVEATCAFYRRVLGMDVVTFGEGRRALRFGHQKINLHAAGHEPARRAAHPTPGAGDLCLLTTAPLADWIAHVRTCGVPVEEGPVKRAGALGPIESIYLRDPDDNLVEIARAVDGADDELAPLRAWLREWEARVRARDFAGGRAMCAPDLVAFGTVAAFVAGVDDVMREQWQRVWPRIENFTVRVAEARGAVAGARAWVAAPWDSLGVGADGATFSRPGRLTIAFERRGDRWLATYTHFSLSPEG
jgi:catechol 2,3-dioxygenase-like lactoylglutathione lyase family enzyme/ketosteroid isomerase-like protein